MTAIAATGVDAPEVGKKCEFPRVPDGAIVYCDTRDDFLMKIAGRGSQIRMRDTVLRFSRWPNDALVGDGRGTPWGAMEIPERPRIPLRVDADGYVQPPTPEELATVLAARETVTIVALGCTGDETREEIAAVTTAFLERRT